LRHLPTVAPNQARLGRLETRHTKLSMHIKVEENGAWNALQIVA